MAGGWVFGLIAVDVLQVCGVVVGLGDVPDGAAEGLEAAGAEEDLGARLGAFLAEVGFELFGDFLFLRVPGVGFAVGADALREGRDGVADALQDVRGLDAAYGEGAGAELG